MNYIDLCLKTTGKLDLLADLSKVGISLDDIGRGVAIDYIGRMIDQPAQIDPDNREEIAAPIYFTDERANVRLWGEKAEAWRDAIVAGPHEHGTEYITPQPANPRRVWL